MLTLVTLLFFLVVLLVAFAFWGGWISKSSVNTDDAALRTDKVRLLHYSLAAANLNVAGTVFALTNTSVTHGALALVGPVFVLLGLFCFLALSGRLGNGGVADTPALNLVGLVSTLRDKGVAGGRGFVAVFARAMFLISVLVLGWEMYVGSRAICYIVAPEFVDSWIAQIGISALLLFSVSIYVRQGGFTAVVLTDVAQFFAIIVFLIILIWGRFFGGAPPTGPLLSAFSIPPNLSISEIFGFVALVGILNIAGQLQSPINWQIAKSSVSTKALKSVIVKASLLMSICWVTVFLVATLTIAKSAAGQQQDPWLQIIDTQSLPIKMLFIVGICGFLMSSADSLVLGAYNLLHESASVLKSNATVHAAYYDFRTFVPLTLAAAACCAIGLMAARPNIFFSLLAITGTMLVFAPAFVAIAVGHADIVSKSPRLPRRLGLLFGATALTLPALSLSSYSGMVTWATILCFCVAVLISLEWGLPKRG